MRDVLVLGWFAVTGLGAWRFRPSPGGLRGPTPAAVAPDRAGLAAAVDAIGSRALARVPLLAPLSPRWFVVSIAVAVVLVPIVGPGSVVLSSGLVLVGRVGARRAQAREVDRVLDELAPVVDLLRIAVSGGLGVGAAVEAIGRRVASARAAGLDRVVRDLDRGSALDVALQRWAEQEPAPVGELVGVLRTADRGGLAVASSLERLARDFRRRRRRRAEERARRLPVTMLVPLVCCVLPAFALVTVVPMVAVGLGRLRGV